jgi:transposase
MRAHNKEGANGMLRKGKYAWYPTEFRVRAIALGREIGPSRAGKRLGVDPGLLRKWIQGADLDLVMTKEDKLTTEEKERAREDAKELQRLRRENEELKKANAILKEVAHFFSKDRSDLDSRRSLNSANKKTKK